MRAAQAAEAGASVTRFIEAFCLPGGGEWCIVMAPLAIRSMDDVIRARTYSLSDALEWLMDVGQGLLLLHTLSSTFHGDLRPVNVLLGEDNRAIITDLGIAMHNHRFGMDRDALLKCFSVSLPPEIGPNDDATAPAVGPSPLQSMWEEVWWY